MKEEKIVFGKELFADGACASFVKDAGRVAVDVRATFSIDPEDVRKRLATHSFIEFVQVSTGACLVQAKDPETGEAQPPCIFLLTDAALSNAVLRQIGKRICTELSCAVFLFANGKAKMKPVQTDQDPRFESFAQTLASLARRLFEDPR